MPTRSHIHRDHAAPGAPGFSHGEEAPWQRREIRVAVENKAQLCGLAVAEVDPAYTSRTCSRCGLLGIRKRHVFRCPSCGHEAHADINAAHNIRLRYTVLRGGGPPSTGPEALPGLPGEGKPRLQPWGS